MSKIFDNIETKFEEGLHAILTNVGVERADFCVGYFNLRGWKQVAADIDKLPGGDALEKNAKGVVEPVKRVCRLLIGMHRPQAELIREMYEIEKKAVDHDQITAWRRQVAREFRKQLTLGVPTADDEKVLKTLRQQLVDEKVCVKLHLRYPLHAKLYLAHRPQDTSNPIMSIMGSSIAGVRRVSPTSISRRSAFRSKLGSRNAMPSPRRRLMRGCGVQDEGRNCFEVGGEKWQ